MKDRLTRSKPSESPSSEILAGLRRLEPRNRNSTRDEEPVNNKDTSSTEVIRRRKSEHLKLYQRNNISSTDTSSRSRSKDIPCTSFADLTKLVRRQDISLDNHEPNNKRNMLPNKRYPDEIIDDIDEDYIGSPESEIRQLRSISPPETNIHNPKKERNYENLVSNNKRETPNGYAYLGDEEKVNTKATSFTEVFKNRKPEYPRLHDRNNIPSTDISRKSKSKAIPCTSFTDIARLDKRQDISSKNNKSNHTRNLSSKNIDCDDDYISSSGSDGELEIENFRSIIPPATKDYNSKNDHKYERAKSGEYHDSQNQNYDSPPKAVNIGTVPPPPVPPPSSPTSESRNSLESLHTRTQNTGKAIENQNSLQKQLFETTSKIAIPSNDLRSELSKKLTKHYSDQNTTDTESDQEANRKEDLPKRVGPSNAVYLSEKNTLVQKPSTNIRPVAPPPPCPPPPHPKQNGTLPLSLNFSQKPSIQDNPNIRISNKTPISNISEKPTKCFPSKNKIVTESSQESNRNIYSPTKKWSADAVDHGENNVLYRNPSNHIAVVTASQQCPPPVAPKPKWTMTASTSTISQKPSIQNKANIIIQSNKPISGILEKLSKPSTIVDPIHPHPTISVQDLKTKLNYLQNPSSKNPSKVNGEIDSSKPIASRIIPRNSLDPMDRKYITEPSTSISGVPPPPPGPPPPLPKPSPSINVSQDKQFNNKLQIANHKTDIKSNILENPPQSFSSEMPSNAETNPKKIINQDLRQTNGPSNSAFPIQTKKYIQKSSTNIGYDPSHLSSPLVRPAKSIEIPLSPSNIRQVQNPVGSTKSSIQSSSRFQNPISNQMSQIRNSETLRSQSNLQAPPPLQPKPESKIIPKEENNSSIKTIEKDTEGHLKHPGNIVKRFLNKLDFHNQLEPILSTTHSSTFQSSNESQKTSFTEISNQPGTISRSSKIISNECSSSSISKSSSTFSSFGKTTNSTINDEHFNKLMDENFFNEKGTNNVSNTRSVVETTDQDQNKIITRVTETSTIIRKFRVLKSSTGTHSSSSRSLNTNDSSYLEEKP